MAKLTMEWVHYSHNWGAVRGHSPFGCTVMGRALGGHGHVWESNRARHFMVNIDFYRH